MKIHSVLSELFHADRQTDRQTEMTKLIVPFPNFHNAPRDSVLYLTVCLWFYMIFTKTGIIYQNRNSPIVINNGDAVLSSQ